MHAGATLLKRLQDDIRHNVRSEPASVDATDRSVKFHACYGPIREVQAAPDALLHCLAADPQPHRGGHPGGVPGARAGARL